MMDIPAILNLNQLTEAQNLKRLDVSHVVAGVIDLATGDDPEVVKNLIRGSLIFDIADTLPTDVLGAVLAVIEDRIYAKRPWARLQPRKEVS